MLRRTAGQDSILAPLKKKHSKNLLHETIRILEQNLISYYEVTRPTKTTRSLEANRGLNNSHYCFLSAPHWDPLHLWPLLHQPVPGVKSILQRHWSRSLQKRSKFFLLINCVSSFFFLNPPLQESKWLDERELVGTAGSHSRVDGTLLLKCYQQSLFFDPWLLASSPAQRMFLSLKWRTTRAKKRSYRA